MNQTEHFNEADSTIPLKAIIAGAIAAILLIISIGSIDAIATMGTPDSESAWVTTTLTAVRPSEIIEVSSPEEDTTSQVDANNEESGHFLDALYSLDFMSSFTEPT